jgi:hypothetical protein
MKPLDKSVLLRIFDDLGGIEPVDGDVFTPVSELEIVAIENDMGVRLPEVYRTFLMTYGASMFGGTSPDNPHIEFRPLNPLPSQFEGGNGLLAFFYGAERHDDDMLGLRTRIRYYSGRMPENIIPIADSWGSQICLGIKGAEAEMVYFWDEQHEPQDEASYFQDFGEPRPPGTIFQNVHLIANSFEDLLRQLKVADPE